MENSSPPLRSSPSLLRRAGLAAGAFVVVVAMIFLVIVGWPVAVAVSGVLAGFGQPIAYALLAFGLVLLVAGGRAALAFSRRLEGLADQAALAQMPNGHPVYARDLREAGLALLPQSMSRHYDVALAEAQRQFPQLTGYHQSIRMDHALAAPAVEPPPALIEAPPGLDEAVRRGLSSPDRYYIGLDATGAPQQLVLKHTGFVAISGVQGTGKTNMATLVAAQCAAHGGVLFIADPHLGDDESLTTRIAPFSGAVDRFATTPQEISMLIAKVDRIYQARTQNPSPADMPVWLVIDEFMDLMVRKQIEPAAVDALLALSGTGRKKKIFVLLLSQNWSQRLLGPQGVAIRQCVTHAVVCRSSRETAEFLLPSTYAQAATMLRVGQSLFFGAGGEPLLVATPEVKDAELGVAARGRAPRSYKPWTLATPAAEAAASLPAVAPPSAPPIPPTVPIAAPPVPPTEQLKEPTVRQQILYLLGCQPWLTSREISAALGVDLGVIQTELRNLFLAEEITRREPNRKEKISEKFEYAVAQPTTQSTTQSLNSTITPSA